MFSLAKCASDSFSVVALHLQQGTQLDFQLHIFFFVGLIMAIFQLGRLSLKIFFLKFILDVCSKENVSQEEAG